VRWTTTPTLLEAEVTEVRAIHAHAPRYNRRSRHPQRGVHVALTRESFPRLSIVREPRPTHARTIGPFSSRRTAEAVLEAIHEVVPLRTCTGRLRVAQDHPACVLKELGRCGAPCDGSQSPAGYAEVVARLHAALDDPATLVDPLRARMLEVARDGRFERAGELRRRLHIVARTLEEHRRLAALADVDHLVAARRLGGGGADDPPRVEVVVVVRGRLAATAAAADDGRPFGAVVEAALPDAARGPTLDLDDVDPFDAEERRLVLAWLDRPGTHLVATSGGWAEALAGGRVLAETRVEARRVDRQVRRDRQVLTGTKVTRRDPVAAP
jgi:DNA polymerase III subunit epsilon